MSAHRAAHVLVIFGATHRSLSGKAAKERVDGLTIEGLKLTQPVHISLCHLKVRRCTVLGTALSCPIVVYLVSDCSYQNRLASTVTCMKSVPDRTRPMLCKMFTVVMLRERR